MADEHLGLSLRFIRSYDKERYKLAPDSCLSMQDRAWLIAMHDTRDDASFEQKLDDALAFIKSRIH